MPVGLFHSTVMRIRSGPPQSTGVIVPAMSWPPLNQLTRSSHDPSGARVRVQKPAPGRASGRTRPQPAPWRPPKAMRSLLNRPRNSPKSVSTCSGVAGSTAPAGTSTPSGRPACAVMTISRGLPAGRYSCSKRAPSATEPQYRSMALPMRDGSSPAAPSVPTAPSAPAGHSSTVWTVRQAARSGADALFFPSSPHRRRRAAGFSTAAMSPSGCPER